MACINAEGLQIEDLPQAYQDVAHALGMETALKLSQHFGGLQIYFPKLDNLLMQKRDENICLEFNGSNYGQLSRKHRLSDTHVRKIVNKGRKVRQSE